MRLPLILLCSFLQRIYGSSSSCPSHRVVVQGGKQFNVIPGSPPTSLGCKQDSWVLQDDEGALYCLARNPQPRKLTNVQCQILPKSCDNECGRENPPPLMTNRIQGGEFTTSHRYPWVASLQSNGRHFCTASIISPRALLTAAHCIGINTSPPNNFTAVVGINDLISENMEGQRLKIKKHIIHPKYINGFKDWNVENDIAVLITENIEFNENVGPICLPQKETLIVEEEALILGWGKDADLSRLLTDYKIITEAPMDLMELFRSLQDNTTIDWVNFKKQETEFFKNLFFRFKEIFRNFAKVYDQEMEFLNPATSNESKTALTLEMTDLLKPVLKEKIPDSVEKERIILYILKDAETIFKELLLAPNNTEIKELKDKCSKCSKNWNWLVHYIEKIQSMLSFYSTNKLKEAKSYLLSKEECKNSQIKNSFGLISNVSFENSSMLCLKPITGSGCPGNSGSPSAIKIGGKFVQVGITSSLIPDPTELPIPCGCGCKDGDDDGKPDLHQPVSICINWIIQQLENNHANPCRLNYL